MTGSLCASMTRFVTCDVTHDAVAAIVGSAALVAESRIFTGADL
jgi:hypothetical protein